MANNKIERFGPTLMVSGATGQNLLNPAGSGTAIGYTATASYAVVRKMRITNITASAATFQMFVGATSGTATGTAFWGYNMSVAANTGTDWQGYLRLGAADFLTANVNTANALVWEGEGEIGLS